jgi:DNA modification methylase
LAILPEIEAGSVDAVVFDPPYGIDLNIRGQAGRQASWAGTTIHGDSDTAVRDFVIAWATERGLPWAAFGTWKRPKPKDCRTVLVWDKGPAFGMGDLSIPWKSSWEEIYIGGDGWEGHRGEGVLRGHQVVSWETKGRCHPNQKPVSLITCLLSKLPHARTILDPTAGSGSTGVACLKAGLDAILIDSDERWMPVASRRLREAETPLFAGMTG